ncbi:hypothetical protein FTO60_01065 [Octadecabacter sp. SW4]|uniref:DUF6732 family protein n=1 Tax=Octadecabacter sp. SW4 TaxID=2602067 RepID=UPI0011C1D6C1|nr:DUF6732 family protein [Octadecabacter sp. SW4]QEE34419.1 hypothetical protein FTO60_01065 [Octadecabacter sp. SW4]|tara:strand:+ start:625 stop:843 length:219 start_codon:yes stop_codon:yes gene_type:complete
MRTTLTLIAMLFATSAAADPGHIADVAGHNHWVAGAAVGVAVLVGLWGALKGRGGKETSADTEDEPEEEATA